ncbi:MAG TPA: hypothetical protein VEL31_04370 [Ktedonobacteraceae bacterium]|nr:hypothetical protein [Ktedonobacteraceae bacterium]
MVERPYSRYTRAKTWVALYSQHINAGYALVPWSRTNNSIDVINCKDASKGNAQDIARDTQRMTQELLQHADDIATYYRERQTPDHAPTILATAVEAKKLRSAVVLAKSSDYYYYHIEDIPGFTLVICGLHNSYLHVPVWEMNTNHRYKARETAIAITHLDFNRIRCTQLGHSILVAAYAKGDPDAIAFVERKSFPERTRSRLKSESDQLQHQTYRGRPLAFRNDAERKEVGDKISESLKQYHARKRLCIM